MDVRDKKALTITYYLVHVIVGTIFIYIGFLRIINYNVTKQGHIGVETAILYWHFVDIVWLFLFIAVYFWGSN